MKISKKTIGQAVLLTIYWALGALPANGQLHHWLDPGETRDLHGIRAFDSAELRGNVISSVVHPFAIEDTLGNVIMTGSYEDRVVRSSIDGQLIFEPQIRDLEAHGESISWVVAMSRDGFAESRVGTEYISDSAGNIAPNAVTRSEGAGDSLHYRYSPNDITPPESGRYLAIGTNTPAFNTDGAVTIFAANDIGGLAFNTTIPNISAPIIHSTPTSICDLDLSGRCDAGDLDWPLGLYSVGDLQIGVPVNGGNSRFNFFQDDVIDERDLDEWLAQAARDNGLNRPYSRGDVNLDGKFDSGDLVQLFKASHYEDGVLQNSTWETGDWNGDREFDSADLVLAFKSGAYESDSIGVATVPEPETATFGLAVVLAAIANGRRRRITVS